MSYPVKTTKIFEILIFLVEGSSYFTIPETGTELNPVKVIRPTGATVMSFALHFIPNWIPSKMEKFV